MTVISSREFNRDVSAAKRAAEEGPVTITDRGEPAHVLLTIADYKRLTTPATNVVDRLSMDADVDFAIRPLDISLRIPDL